MQPHIIIVSNRLPISVKKTSVGGLEFFPSVGGLATGLSSYVSDSKHNIWIGWPGIASDDLTETDKVTITTELAQHHCHPVFLTQQQLDEYYSGFSNSVLWPLLHNLPLNEARGPAWWAAYRAVNGLFTETVAALTQADSTIWVHDYQLLLMPGLLRSGGTKLGQIGFFSHIPFPPSEIFGELPEAKALMSGMLGADLVGFHTPSYATNFLQVCQQLHTGLVTGREVVLPGHVTKVADFPMGIDYTKFVRATRARAVKAELRRYKRLYRGTKVILTVDRLDPTKGLVERLKAYRTLLKNSPQLRGKVTMVMLAMPSRTEIAEYQALRVSVEKLVTDINKTYGTNRWQPVDYNFTTLPFEKLSALYQLADVAFIAPLRDGMNLVAKEYVASQSRKGVLILSATAGAAEELHDALIVDPHKPATLVAALYQALTMPKKELRRRLHNMQRRIADFTVHEWAGSFMTTLLQPGGQHSRTRPLAAAHREKIVKSFQAAHKRLFLLDYDGVLVAYAGRPDQAQPTAKLHQLIAQLAANKANEVVILSGRQRADLESWFGDLPVALAAEHGALFRRKGGRHWHKTSQSPTGWKDVIRPIMAQYAALTPGALVEEKDWSMVWHYRQATAYTAQKNLVILRHLIRPLLQRYNLLLQDGNKILEVRPADFNKGKIAQEWLIHEHDFVLALGDDITDEDTFAVLPADAYSIRVGRGRTLARYRLATADQVITLLESLAK